MKRYTPAPYIGSQYTGNARRKKRTRILLILASAALIFVLSVLLGNYLLEQRLRAEPVLAIPDGLDTIGTGRAESILTLNTIPNKETPASPFCAWAPDTENPAESIGRIAALATEEYSGISIVISDTESYRFALKTCTALLPEEMSESLLSREILRNAATAAKTNGLLSCAALCASDLFNTDTLISDAAVSFDSAVAGELFELGFTEVLFTNLRVETLDDHNLTVLIGILDKIRASAPDLKIGFVLPEQIFRDGPSAPYLDALAARTDFLALEISTETDDAVSLCDSLRGSISYYSLQLVLREDSALSEALREELVKAGFTALLPLV